MDFNITRYFNGEIVTEDEFSSIIVDDEKLEIIISNIKARIEEEIKLK